MDDSRKKYVLKKVHDCWRKSKNKLKKRAFEVGTTVAQQVAARPEYIPKEDWATLCHYWQTPEAMTKSEVNKANRDGNIMPHTGGRKTITQWREEKRLPDGTLMERAEIFAFLRRKRSTGEPVNEFARKTLEDIESKKQLQPASSDKTIHRNDTLAQVLGPDSQSHVRGLGGGVTPTSVFGSHRVSATQTTESHAELLRERQLRESHQHQIEIHRQQIETQQAQIVAQQQQIEAQQEKFETQEKKIESQDQQIAELKKAQDDMFEMFMQTQPQV